MNYQTPNDKQYRKEKEQLEYRCQGIMDNWYQAHGYSIVNRDGSMKQDLVLSNGNGKIRVEEKYRNRDYGDFLIELLQDIVSNNPGWFYTENKVDRLAYIITDDGKPIKFYWIKFQEFRDWLFDYLKSKSNVKAVISPRGYGITMNISIPWKPIIDDKLCQEFYFYEIPY